MVGVRRQDVTSATRLPQCPDRWRPTPYSRSLSIVGDRHARTRVHAVVPAVEIPPSIAVKRDRGAKSWIRMWIAWDAPDPGPKLGLSARILRGLRRGCTTRTLASSVLDDGEYYTRSAPGTRRRFASLQAARFSPTDRSCLQRDL